MRLRADRELTERGGYGVARQLHVMRSDAGVFWSERGNSYVACRRADGSFVIYSINGIGEIRWPIDPASARWQGDKDAPAAVAYFFEGV